jgi:CheY-specific phosphatase CheX
MGEQVESAGAAVAQPDFAGTLRRVGGQVLETMFFDEAVPSPCDHGWISSAISVCLSFEGSHCGQFLLNVAPSVARSITSAFLGIDPEEMLEEQSGQVLLELANILCGSVLSQLWPDSNLTLGAPQPVIVEGPIEDALHECFRLPEGLLSVSIQMCGVEPD